MAHNVDEVPPEVTLEKVHKLQLRLNLMVIILEYLCSQLLTPNAQILLDSYNILFTMSLTINDQDLKRADVHKGFFMLL